jgi:hypothetical protein
LRLSTQSIFQFGIAGTQTLMAQLCQPGKICFTLRYCAKNPLAAGSQQIADDTRQLDLTLFEQSFQLALNLNLIARQLIFGSGQRSPRPLLRFWHVTHQISGCKRLTARCASRESVLRPRGPRFDRACARCKRHYPSRANHTGLQYCAVDSITTSRTAHSCSHADRWRSSLTVVPNRRHPNRSSRSPALATTTASIFLWTSIPTRTYCASMSSSLA